MDRDSPTPTKKVSPWGAVIAALVLACCSYFFAYLALGERWTMRLNANSQIMNYRHEWQATFFRPAAQLDSLLFQRRVTTDSGLGRL
jgi:hypothetical protein